MLRTIFLASAALAAAPLAAQAVNTLGTGNTLVTVNASAPGTVTASRAITGLAAGETLLGLDYRPATGNRVFYSTGSSGQLYAVNPFTGTATAVGAPLNLGGATAAAYDFNPVPDRLRVVLNTGANLRVNPNDGTAIVDTPVAYAAGDVAAGVTPRITGAAYTNSVAGATTTTLYVIDSGRGTLALQGSLDSTPVSPNTGQLTTVGSLGVTTSDRVGFDISGTSGQALATLTDPTTNVTSLYSVNLATGQATVIGSLGGAFTGLAFAPVSLAATAQNANQAALGNGLNAFVGVPGAALVNLQNGVAGSTASQGALRQLTPGAYAMLPELTLRTAELQEVIVRRYLRDYRAGGTGVEGQAGEAAPGDRRFGSWLVARGTTGHYDPTADRDRIEYSEAAVVGGLDTRFGEKSVIGIYGGYNNARPRLDNASQTSEIKNYFGGGYTTLALGPVYLDVFGSYGEASYFLRRQARFGAFDNAFAGRTRSRTWLAGGTAGLQFQAGGVEVEPFAGLRYANLKIRGFTDGSETTTVGGLALGETRYESLLHNVGLRVGGTIPVGAATVRPEIRGSWRREWLRDGKDARSFGYTLVGGGGGTQNLVFTAQPLDRDYATVGAGFTVSGPRSPFSIVVDYTGDFDRDRQQHSVTGGFRLTF